MDRQGESAAAEPRILLGDRERSYHAAHRVTDHDIFDNRLIFGDNLLALKALEQEFAGRVKCVFIDPPYNTGSAFEQYDDGLEHSIWLTLMRERLELLRRLLTADGSIWITIDDNEAHYLKIMCDEVFGRQNFVSNVIWEKADSPRNSARQFSTDHDHVLVFSRNPDWIPSTKTSHWGGGVTPEQMREMRWLKPKLIAQIRFGGVDCRRSSASRGLPQVACR